MEIINALTGLINKLYIEAKKGDHIVHFVDSNPEGITSDRKFIEVFHNTKKFFAHFKIDENDRNIIVEIIPEQYFRVIDNIKFEQNITKLMNKFEYRLFPY